MSEAATFRPATVQDAGGVYLVPAFTGLGGAAYLAVSTLGGVVFLLLARLVARGRAPEPAEQRRRLARQSALLELVHGAVPDERVNPYIPEPPIRRCPSGVGLDEASVRLASISARLHLTRLPLQLRA